MVLRPDRAARVGDLTSFRTGTRTKLGEYTNHFLLQRVVDESREELKITGSLVAAWQMLCILIA